jgi:hypothetical protein
MKLSFSGSGDLARGGFDLWDVRAVAGSVLGFVQRRCEAGGRPEGGMVHGAGCGPCARLCPHSVSQPGIALQLHDLKTPVCNHYNNELFVLGIEGVGLEHGTRELDKGHTINFTC